MPYRDELEALEHRQAHLEEELGRIDEALARARKLDRERAIVSRELTEVRTVLGSRRSPLDGVRPASPCSAAWELMEGNGSERRCQACGKRVFNLSGLSRAESARVLMDRGAGTKLHRREDGTLIDGDCPLGSRLRQRGRTVVTGGTVALVGAGLLVAAAAPEPPGPSSVDASTVDGAALLQAPNVEDVPARGVDDLAVELEDEVDVEVESTRPRRR